MTPVTEHDGQEIPSKMPNGHERPQSDPFASLMRFRTIEHSPTNLPAQTTQLIGREEELKAATELLMRDDIRLVSLTGSGGSGKTRLSIEAARTIIEKFPAGVFFVSLAPLTDANLVVSEIMRTLGVTEKKEVSLTDGLKDYLKDKRMLLVLDNFEHVISAAPIVAELLSRCPMLKILTTSRSPLRIRGEHEFLVLPLPIPTLKNLPTIDVLQKNASVALFVQRAQNVRSGFCLTSHNARTIAEICARLDGLPLALELAAARIRILSPDEMLRLLEKRLELLTSGALDLPARQRTLRDTIAWSYDLLDRREKKLFRRLSVFASGFSLEAAEATCNAPGDLQGEVIDGLSRLLEKSLLRREEVDGESRFIMLDTVREFALELLNASDESHPSLKAYADYFLSIAEKAEPQLKGPEQDSWLKCLDREHENLRAAVRWSMDNKQTDTALRFVSALWRFWYTRGYLTEGRLWIAAALVDRESVRNAFRARALLGAGVLALYHDDFPAASSLLDESLALSRELGDEEAVAFALNYLGTIAENKGDFGEAFRLQEESLALFRKVGNNWDIAFALNGLGVAVQNQGDYDKASTLHKESLQLFRETGDRRYIARSLGNLGTVLERKGEFDAARKLISESLSLSRELGEVVSIAESLLDLGRVVRRQGSCDEAQAIIGESLSLSQRLGHVDVIALCLEQLAACAFTNGRVDRMARLLGAAEALREAKHSPIPPAYRPDILRDLAAARSALNEQLLAKEWARGRTMTLEQTIAYALTLESAD